ncbi:MAG: LysM peptidoglycan-binding domain-containing protein [Nocardioidaceae bacterium]
MLLPVLRPLICLVALGTLGVPASAIATEGAHDLLDLAAEPEAAHWMTDVLVAAGTCLAGVAGVVLAAGGALTVLTTLRDTRAVREPGIRPLALRAAWSMSPAWWRRVLLACCGLGLSAVPVAATAGTAGPTSSGECPPRCEATVTGLPMPELPAARDTSRVRVQPGDTLWHIAAAHLPPASTAARVARDVDWIHSANRAAIGPDPDLIFPGTHLTIPGGAP